jgi:5'-3' exonuclease
VVPLLQEFETVEQIYATIEGMSKQEEASFKELCKDLGISRSPLAYLLKTTSNPVEPLGKDAAYLSKVLATIKTDIPFYESLPLDDIMLQVNDQGLLDIWASNWNLTV